MSVDKYFLGGSKMQHSVLIFLAFLALGWSPTRMENLGYNQLPQRNVKELRIGGIFTEDQYQLDTIQVSCLSKHNFYRVTT